jgi:hypothetical protein
MGTNILGIMDAIGALSIGTSSKTPIVHKASEAVESIKVTPARMIFCLQMGESEGRSITTVSLGRTQTATWQITDLMLYSSAKKGTLLSASTELVEYVDNYISVMQDNQKLGFPLVTVEGLDIEWGEYPFPPKSKNVYYGVIVTLTVKEIIE